MDSENNQYADDEQVEHQLDMLIPDSIEEVGVSPMEHQSYDMPRYKIPRRTVVLCLFLFLATCFSTFFVGAGLWAGVLDPRFNGVFGFLDTLGWGNVIWRGLSYSVPVMSILLAHEMGHFLQAVRYRVPATPPFFIPMPLPPLGTMGAVIMQQAGVSDRKSNFDIAISGPLAGLVVALPICWYSVTTSTVAPVPAPGTSIEFGDPLILQWMYWMYHGHIPEGMTVFVSQLGIAGWVGIFITALNLIPIGQLDGGHILYALIGKKAHTVAMTLVAFAIAYMIWTNNYTYALMLGLIVFMGAKHPPTADDTVPLGGARVVLGWLTLGFIIIGFTPQPLIIG